MSRISNVFEKLKQKNEKALIPFITAGDPDSDTTDQLLKCLVDNGADIIELGVPFSDPMADGPTIQAASQRALTNSFSMERIFDHVKKVRTYSETPIILFGYYNPFLHYGIDKLCTDAKDAGVDAFLIVDLPPEEASEIKKYADDNEIDIIFLLAPTSTDDRIKLIANKASGFIYFVSVTGVTGARSSLDTSLSSYIKQIRKFTDLPVGIGFGISSPEHVREVAEYTDAVIVGSAIIKIIEKNSASPDLISTVGDFVHKLKCATLPE
jgi:tryptophan synthase alpha chain